MRKYLTCAIDTVSVEDLRESKFEALALYFRSFAKLDYVVWHKSYSRLLLLLSWRQILAHKWKYLKISGHFSWPVLIRRNVNVSINIIFKKGHGWLKIPTNFLVPIYFSCSSTSYSKHKQVHVKDTHRENTPSNKTEALTKSMIMYIRAIGTLVPVHWIINYF